MLALLPTPAVPPVDFARAIRDGWAASLALAEAATADAGLSTDEGEVAVAAAAIARDGTPPVGSCGLRVGTVLA